MIIINKIVLQNILKEKRLKVLLIYFLHLEANNQVNSESDSESEESKKPRYRHRLLRHKLTMSDGESGEDKKMKPKEHKEAKSRNRRKGKHFECKEYTSFIN